MQILKAVLLLLITSFVPQKAMAMDTSTLLILQSTLNDHLFNVGEPDGNIGPATRRGLEEFAETYGTSSDPQAVLSFIIQKSVAARQPIEDEIVLKDIEEEIAAQLRDPSSVMIRNVFKVENPSTTFICGEVNGKNAYGGYAGFNWFYGMDLTDLMGGSFVFLTMDRPDFALAELQCLMSFPLRQG
jgi:hypothetical protein